MVPGNIGTCTDVPAMTDPDGECGLGGYCDSAGVCVNGADGGPMLPDAGPVDAGPMLDAARFIDSGATLPDAGTTTPPSDGGCSVSQRRAPTSYAALLGLGLAALALARRRR